MWLGGEFGFALVFSVLAVRDSSPFEAVAPTTDGTGVFTPALSCGRAMSDCNPIAKKKKKREILMPAVKVHVWDD